MNWEELEKSFQEHYQKVQEKMAVVRQSLLNRKIDQAIEQLKDILNTSPKNVEAQNLLIYCLKEKGQSTKELQSALETTFEIDPSNVLTNFNFGEFYFEQKDYAKALEYYKRSQQTCPTNSKILYQVGLTYQKLKSYKEACDFYEKAISVDPKYRKPYINACALFDKLDEHSKMMKYMEELKTNFSQSSKALNMVTALYNNFPEKNDEMEENFETVKSIDPNNLLNIYNQAIYWYTQNELEKSIQMFTRVIEDPYLKTRKTHPLLIFSELHISILLERQSQINEARKHLINVSENLNGFLTPADVNTKIAELQKVLAKKRSSYRSSFLVVDGDLIGTKELVNNGNEQAPAISQSNEQGLAVSHSDNKGFNETEHNTTTQSDRKSSPLHFSKQNSRVLESSKRSSKNWDKESCLKYLQEDPNHFEAHIRLGTIYLEEGDLHAAKEKFWHCLDIDPEKDPDRIYVLLSEVSRQEKDYETALNYLGKVQDLEENIEGLTCKAACEEKLGHVDQAKSFYQKALDLPYDHAPLETRYGWFLIKLGDIKLGTEHLLKAYNLNPNHLKTHKKLGRAYLLSDENKIDEAFHHFNFVHETNANDYIGLLGLGQAYERRGEYEKALEFLQQASEHKKADINCQFFLGTVYSKLREFKKAQEIFRNVLKQDSNHVEACVEIATIFTLLKEYEKAKKYFKHAIKNNPDNIIANLRYGKICQVYLKDYESAMECYQRILNVDSTHHKSYYQIGLMQYDQKKYNEAHENFKNALKANPKYAPAWKAIGILLFENNKIESSLKYFDKAITYDPKDIETKIYIGNCHYELQNNDKAIEVYQDVLKIEESADIHYNIANSYYMKSELDDAIEHYTASLRINPARAECWYNLGNAYCMKGDYDQAVQNFKKSLEIDGQNVAAFYNLGNAYLLLKDIKLAIDSFEEALKLDPENNEWKVMLAGVYLEDMNYDNVFRLCKEVLAKNGNDLDAMMLIVQCHEGRGEYADAMKNAKKIHLLKPNYEGIQEKIAALSEKVKT